MLPKVSIKMDMALLVFSGIFLFMASLTVFQDLLESKRSGYAFYFSESLLFKTLWFLFIPILTVLYKQIKAKSLDSSLKTAIFIITPIAVHFLIAPLVAVFLSALFYEERYGLYKMFSYTLANDFYNLVIVYGGFVLGCKYLAKPPKGMAVPQMGPPGKGIVVNNGKDNVIVRVEDIMLISSATPYIFIHLGNKKYLHSETLKSICGQLDNTVFVRVHKSVVVNTNKVVSFRSRLNGDYDLQLVNGDTVRLSRTYAANFKKYFKSGHQDTV